MVTTRKNVDLNLALDLAAGAYSDNRYKSWPRVAQLLLDRGLTPKQAAAVMRSKWTRWAADAYDPANGGKCAANAIIKFMDDPRNRCTPAEIDDLVAQTFGE